MTDLPGRNKMRQHRKFTLVELLVALGVFSILLVVFMQIFSGMRLAWTNTEKRSDSHYTARIAMDMLSLLVGSMYYTNAETETLGKTVQFPFKLKRSDADSSKPAALYFASKTNIDLPGTSSVRFIGVQYATPVSSDFKFGLSDERKELHALYLTVISNAEKDYSGENSISSTNKDIYHRFWPAPVFLDKNENASDADGALEYLVEVLDAKLKPQSSGVLEAVKLLDRVTEFRVRLFDAEGNEIDGSAKETSRMPQSLEVSVSVLSDADFETWITGGKNEEFRLKNQMTFTRHVHIGNRWKMEDKYDKY